MNNTWERMWKEEVVAYFKVLVRRFPGGTEETHENPLRTAGLRDEI
jgi:hypothetical protein